MATTGQPKATPGKGSVQRSADAKKRPSTSLLKRAQIDADPTVTMIIGVSFALIILAQMPLFDIHLKTAAGYKRPEMLSPLEVTAMYASNHLPVLKPAVQTLMLPGSWFKGVGILIRDCFIEDMSSNPAACRWSRLWDAQYLWSRTDNSEAEPQLSKAVGEGYTLLVAACAVVTISGLTCFVKPIKSLVLGIGLLLLSLYFIPDAQYQPPIFMVAFLAVFLVFVDPRQASWRAVLQAIRDDTQALAAASRVKKAARLKAAEIKAKKEKLYSI